MMVYTELYLFQVIFFFCCSFVFFGGGVVCFLAAFATLLGQGLNPNHSSEPSCCSDNADPSPKHHRRDPRSFSKWTLFVFSFLAIPRHMEFLGQGSGLRHSCDLCSSCSNTGSFNPLFQARNQTCILVLQRHHHSCCPTVGTLGQFLYMHEINNFYCWSSRRGTVVNNSN